MADMERFVHEVAKCSLYKDESADGIGALVAFNYLILKARKLSNWR